MPVVSSIYDALMSDTIITDELATYKYSSADPETPAVFSLEEAPDDADSPFILIRPVAGERGGSFEDRGYKGGLSVVDVVVYSDKSRSSKKLRDISTSIWDRLHRNRLAGDDDFELACFADFPKYLADPNGFPGYVVSCFVKVRKK